MHIAVNKVTRTLLVYTDYVMLLVTKAHMSIRVMLKACNVTVMLLLLLLSVSYSKSATVQDREASQK